MGLHHRHMVGRALSGDEAREALEMHKRDSHGDHIVLNIPADLLNAAATSDVQTAVSVVYVTLSQTFSGSASLSTMTGGDATSTSATHTQAEATSESHSASSASPTLATEPTTAATSTSAPLTSAATSSSVAMATATAQGARPAPASSSPSASATETQNHGMSGAGKAGLAIGILLALVLMACLAFFCWRRRKNPDDHEEITDEKHTSFVDAGARSYEARHNAAAANVKRSSITSSLNSTASTAPRLTLRPVTQFLPNLAGNANHHNEKPRSAWERTPANGQQNPFADNAAMMHTDRQGRSPSPPHNPFDENQTPNGSRKHTPQSSWEGSEPPTPKSTKFGTASAISVASAGSANAVAPPRGPNNVHRVQLDFKPSMEDELELRSGQLVRMLHEYDDGWALCIRMDRSQQGVAPRTCLSKLPVKPRPQGPPPGSRPGTAGSQGPRPNGPPGPGPYSRPHTPQQGPPRGQTPDLGGVPSRKPVPGQAM